MSWKRGALISCTAIGFALGWKEKNGKADSSVEMLRIQDEFVNMLKAQKMKVSRVEKLFGDNDIDEILKFESENSSLLGITKRDSSGFKKMDGSWTTTYLNTDGLFQKILPTLTNKLIDLAIATDLKENWCILNGSKQNLQIRVIELHRVSKRGGLPDPKHHDNGSLVTIDVMCSSKDEFEGGQFMTLEEDGNLQSYVFEKGDVLVFPSHKYHCVQPVRSGDRRVLVMELWRGEERHCAHRCLSHLGPCSYTAQQSKVELMLTSCHPEVDPW